MHQKSIKGHRIRKQMRCWQSKARVVIPVQITRRSCPWQFYTESWYLTSLKGGKNHSHNLISKLKPYGSSHILMNVGSCLVCLEILDTQRRQGLVHDFCLPCKVCQECFSACVVPMAFSY